LFTTEKSYNNLIYESTSIIYHGLEISVSVLEDTQQFLVAMKLKLQAGLCYRIMNLDLITFALFVL
jgi:hypothetical protein